MAKHKHGEMDTTVQEKTFHMVTKGALISIALLIFIALVNG